MRDNNLDAVVVGSGPNGLSAAIEVARTGRSVRVYEAEETIGGASRTLELTLPGFVHDFGSAIHPLAAASPFFRTLPLSEHGLEWVLPPMQLAHPFDDGSAIVLYKSLEDSTRSMGADGQIWAKLMRPFVDGWNELSGDVLGQLKIPRHPFLAARFGELAVRPASMLAKSLFEGEHARALFVGMAAHSFVAPDQPLTSAFGLMLGVLAHIEGWTFPRGGAQAIPDALASYLRSLGGEIVTGTRIADLSELPPSRVRFFDVTPQQFLDIGKDRVTGLYRKQLERYRQGPAAFKVDWALDGPIPWDAAECGLSATVHLGGSFEEIVRSELEVSRGRHPERPYVLVAQHTPFDSSRAPEGKHTAWAYCHVPNGSTVDMTERIERQIERFAPGFRDRILARSVMPPFELESRDANLVGGDINGGLQDWRQFFTRPVISPVPYVTSLPGTYLCSSSTPPGGGVHGLCGYGAAKAALHYSFHEYELRDLIAAGRKKMMP